MQYVDAILKAETALEGITDAMSVWELNLSGPDRVKARKLRRLIEKVSDELGNSVSSSTRRTARIAREAALTGLEVELF